MPTQNEDYDGVDALMAAITGEPLPEAARADAAFMAEHRSATADVALLREQLGIIGEALAAPPPRPEPAPVSTLRRPARRRRPALRTLAYGTLALAVVTGMISGLAWLVSHSGGVNSASSSNADSKSAGDAGAGSKAPGPLSDPAVYVACSRLLVEGTVTGVQPGSDPRKRITLAVTRSYRPAHGPADVTVVLPAGASPAPRQGQHVLVGVPKGSGTATLWTVGDDAVATDRAAIVDALAGAGAACPAG